MVKFRLFKWRNCYIMYKTLYKINRFNEGTTISPLRGGFIVFFFNIPSRHIS